ncbi:hypothetical protein HOK76_01135 [archaeon]|jgi:hypothetical protein|nr:hypothetical protein [archaeon]
MIVKKAYAYNVSGKNSQDSEDIPYAELAKILVSSKNIDIINAPTADKGYVGNFKIGNKNFMADCYQGKIIFVGKIKPSFKAKKLESILGSAGLTMNFEASEKWGTN